MTLSIIPYILGPVSTNTYLLADDGTKEAVVIDPAGDGKRIAAEAGDRGWRIGSIWLTHAHFDHLAGAGELADACNPAPLVALHPGDYSLWRMEGGAALFGLRIDPGPEPTIELHEGQILNLGSYQFKVRHAPGHTHGHVMFYCESEAVLFCGDVIFRGSIGRTDLPGGDFNTLINSIHKEVLTLPGETRLLTGHGPETTVAEERKFNPFLK
jgi:hydroxyacylglutathione hydrolase